MGLTTDNITNGSSNVNDNDNNNDDSSSGDLAIGGSGSSGSSGSNGLSFSKRNCRLLLLIVIMGLTSYYISVK
jgi:hypothetical protein